MITNPAGELSVGEILRSICKSLPEVPYHLTVIVTTPKVFAAVQGKDVSALIAATIASAT